MGIIDRIRYLEGKEITVDERLGRNLILSSLPLTYSGFVLNYNMHDMQTSYEVLHNMLRTAEVDIKKGNPNLYLHGEGSSSRASWKPKKKGKGKKKVAQKKDIK